MNIYVRTQGARIVREGRHLLVKKENDTYHTLFVEKLRQLVLCGNVDLTAPARSILLRHGVDTVFLSKDGRYLGRFATAEPKNVLLRKRQFLLLDDHDFAVRFCRAVVSGKLGNMATMLMRIARVRERKDAAKNAGEIRSLFPKITASTDIDSLRGLEGRGSALYFAAFPAGLQQNYGFYRRVRRPPTDPVNAVLSLLYTFLFNRVYAAVRIANLDPYCGFLHVPDYGRHSLVLDMMEEFRVIVVDSLVLSLFNLKILQQVDFNTETPQPPAMPAAQDASPDVTRDAFGLMTDLDAKDLFDLPPQRMTDGMDDAGQEDAMGKPAVKLTPEAFARVVENFERKLTTEFHYQPLDKKITYADALVAQARMFRMLVEGEAQDYQPLLLK